MPHAPAPAQDFLSHLEMLDIASLRPHPRNDGRHPPDEIAHLRASIREHDIYRNVVVAQDGTMLAGHGVVLAAAAEGKTHVPGKRMPYGPDDPRALQILIGDNHIARLREQDDAALVALLHELAVDGAAALLGTGFDEASMQALLASVSSGNGEADTGAGRDVEPEIDRAEELREAWGVEVGQLWTLGEHRVSCGDCTDKAVVQRLMGEAQAALAPVDPPYNVGFAYDGATVDDTKTPAAYEDFSRRWFALCQAVSQRQIVTPGATNHIAWARWFDCAHCGVWIKTNALTFGKVSNAWCWEPLFFFGSPWPRRRTNDVFDYPIGQQKDVANHPCPKPLTMWIDLLDHYSEPDDLIYDAFLGSGTTLIACERTGRHCRALEISPAYIAVALQRWADLTGQTPVLLA